MMSFNKFLLSTLSLLSLDLFFSQSIFAQQTNNQSSLTNQAAPSASSVTTGGTNINYQTNNTYQNEVGFGPGIFCRTPTIFIGGNYGGNDLNVSDAIGASKNNANNFQVNAGIVMPFGSRAIETCKTLSDTITRDRQISTQLSMIKACADLQKKGIKVDPEVFPLLKDCSFSVLGRTPTKKQANTARIQSSPSIRTSPSRPIPRPANKLPPKVPQTTKS